MTTLGISGEVEKSCSLDARIQISTKSFLLQASRKARFRKTRNEMT
jgi:hypothetical protein